jgi:hypothetical protein
MKKYRTTKEYQEGGIGPKKKKTVAASKKKTSSAYEARRAESRKQSEENANLTRRQMSINRANRMLENPDAYETSQQRASSPTYKTVSGEIRGISSAERAGVSKGTVGSMTPEAAKRSEAAMKKRPTAPAAKAPAAPARKPGELSPETKAAIERGKSSGASIGKAAGEYTMDEARRKRMKLAFGGMLPKIIKQK